MVSVCLPSDALLQHLPSYLGFSYLGHGVSLHSCSSKAQPLLLTLDERYLLTTALPDLQRGMAPLGPPAPTQPRYDLNQILYDYTEEVRNRFKGLDLIKCLMNYGWKLVTLYRRQGSRQSPWKRNAKEQNGCLRRHYK